MMTRMLAGIAVFSAMAVLDVRPAVADAKVFYPAVCSASNNSDNQYLFRGFNGLGHNGATGTPYLIVQCGLLRDNTLNTNGLAGFKMKIFNQVNCTLSHVDTNGNQTQAVSKFGVANAGFQTFDWGTSINTSVNGGMYSLQCLLYPGSAIYWIWMNEY